MKKVRKKRLNYPVFMKSLSSKEDMRLFYALYRDYQIELQKVTNEYWEIMSFKEACEDGQGKNFYNKKSYLIYCFNRVVGFITYQNVFWENIIYIEDIYIIPKYRGQGIATRALEGAFICSNKNTVVFFFVLNKNKSGHDFWVKEKNYFKWEKTLDGRCRLDLEMTNPKVLKNTTKHVYKFKTQFY